MIATVSPIKRMFGDEIVVFTDPLGAPSLK